MMTAASVASRPCWGDLPKDIQALAERQQGAAFVDAAYPQGGFTGGLAAVVSWSDDTSCFVKGSPADAPMADHSRVEARVGGLLPASVAPRLLWSAETDGWLLAGFEVLPGGEVDLAPDSADLDAVLHLVGRLEGELTPCPVPGLPSVVDVLASLHGGWGELAEHHYEVLGEWERGHLEQLLALDDPAVLAAASAGETLLHCDLRADNLLGTPAGVRAIDWSWAAVGAAWIDAAFLLPQLLLAGHTPERAERLLAERVPAFTAAPADAVTCFAVGITGFWRLKELTGPGGGLGAYRGRAAKVGQAWIDYRLSLA